MPPPPDLERHIRAAKILLFENMSASGYVRLAKDALDQANYFYLDVGSATGWFKSQLLSDQNWDLIIAAVEADRDFGGDYFQLLDQQAEKGVSLVVEYWNYDVAPYGMVDSLLNRCGVKYSSDWYQPDPRVFYWARSDHPVFHEPNEITNLRNASQFWKDDVGDLLEIRNRNGKPTGDALVLASTNPTWKEDHATLVTCLGGRVILQTFRSHEYRSQDMVRLYQNYIYQTLKARFSSGAENAPTPAATFPVPLATQTPNASGKVPEPGAEFACGEAFNAVLTARPKFQKDLFEHHAAGTFLIVRLQLKNLTTFPIQIWDEDYKIEGLVNGQQVTVKPHKAATGYLYIDSPARLIQDVIEPGVSWKTSLAFDVNPDGGSWVLVVRPGSEYKEQVCELRIPLTP